MKLVFRLIGATLGVLAWQSTPARADTTPGLVPLTEMTTPFMGIGEPGLYPGGANEPTGAHADYGDAKTREIVPRNADGTPGDQGLIGVLSIGLSNTNQEWSRFERDSDAAGSHWARVVLVDGAQGGVDAEDMAPANANYWDLVDDRLSASGIADEQVQVVWLKQSLRGEQGTFPTEHERLRDAIREVIGNLENRFRNLQVIYFTSRVYAGYAGREPYGFATAFSVKWLIEEQVDALAAGASTGPFLAWGPYVWANGTCARADGLTWELADFETDGTNPHTSLLGEQKVADQLDAFFTSDPRAQRWFGVDNGPAATVLDAVADAGTNVASPMATNGTDTSLSIMGGNDAYFRFDLSSVTRPVAHAKLSFLTGEVMGIPETTVRTAASETWDEASLSLANAPGANAEVVASLARYARGGAAAGDVTEAVQEALDASMPTLTFVVRHEPASGEGVILTREAGEPPRLVLTFEDDVGAGGAGGTAGTGGGMGGAGGASGSAGAVGGAGGAPPIGSAGSSPQGGAAGDDSTAAVPGSGDDGGCGCSVPGKRRPEPMLLLSLIALLWARRRIESWVAS